MDYNGFVALMAFWGMFLFIFIIIGIAVYILAALGLYNLAQNAGIENPWLAWIPIANMYILGKLVKDLQVSTLSVPSLELVLPIALLVSMALGQVPFIGWLFTLTYFILFILCLNKLFKMYRPEQATLWTILSIIPVMGPIFIFIIRNDRPVAF